MLERLFKNIDSNQFKENDAIYTNNIEEIFEYNISDHGIDVLEKWNKINNVNFNIDSLLSLLQLNRFNFIDINCIDYPMCDDIRKNPDYVGSLTFYSLINKKNVLNKYSKLFLTEIGGNSNIRHNIHFYKDGVILEMDYMFKNKDFRKFRITYKLENIDSKYIFNNVDEYSLIILEPTSIYASITDSIVCRRFKDNDGYFIIDIKERMCDESYTKKIKFKIVNDTEFNFPNEVELMRKIGYKSVSFPENIMAILIDYLKKYNVEVADINIEETDENTKISRNLFYEQNNDKKKVVLGINVRDEFKQVLKTVDVFLEYVNDSYVRVFEIKTADSKDMKLKIRYTNSSYDNKDFEVIDYFMRYFPFGLIDESHEFYSFDVYFELLCEFCFSDNMKCIDMISLESYEYGKLIENKEWKKYNLDQTDSINEGPVLKRK